MLSSLPSLSSMLLFAVLFMVLRTAALLFVLYRHRCSTLHASTVRLRRRSVRGSDADRMHIAASSSSSSSLLSSSSASSSSVAPLRTLAILGSGGHTAELLTVMDQLPRHRYCPLLYVRAATDAGSESKARRREEQRGNQTNASHVAIPRSREVGQSYVSSVWTTLVALAHAVAVVFRFKPELILCNGPGTCFPICFVAFVFKIVLFRPCSLVFIESFCRVESLSLSGLMLYPLVDEFVVQWPELAHAPTTAETAQLESPEYSGLVDLGSKEIRTHGGWRFVKYIGRLC